MEMVISKHFFNAKGLVHHHPIFQAKLMKSGCLFFGFQAEPSVSFWESIFKRCHPGSFWCSHCSRNCSESLDDDTATYWPSTSDLKGPSRLQKNFNEKVIRDPPWNPGGTGQGVKGLILWRKTSLARKIRRFCKSKSKNKFQRETKAWYERSELLVHGRILK